MSSFPNFMVVGGVKCGTTSLYYYLKSHPEVCVPCKESYLFTPRLVEQGRPTAKVHTEASYRALFAESITAHTLAAGEVASIYLYCHDEVIPAVQRLLGDIKIVILLRNPVARAFSHYGFFARDTRDKRSFEEAIRQELAEMEAGRCTLSRPLQYVGMGFYTQQVQAYVEAFSNVKVILFDDFVADTPAVMDDVYQFLEVDPARAQEPGRVYNASGMPRMKWLQNLIFKPTPFKMRIRQFLVDHVIPEEAFARHIESLRSKNLQKVTIPEDMRALLKDVYQEDILQLQQLLNRDLSLWTNV